MSSERFKYLRRDFGPLPARLRHLTLYLSFFEDRVEAQGCLELTAEQDMESLTLDARDLHITRVEAVAGPDDARGRPLGFHYDAQADKLTVELPEPMASGRDFALRLACRSFPSQTLLEGIYQDVTPPGAPQQYMSQCQQWGFSRILPILDDCRAKCTMTTTLEGDARYSHLISNGNLDRERNPQGRPVPKLGDPSRQVITFHNPVPMAPYLFIAAAGTWEELVDQVIYPDGGKVRLEYLVPPGHVDDVRLPMEILKQSVLWVAETQDYRYAHDTYRTITMARSNFGGMENVGNTTIVTDAALVEEEHTLDASLLYAHQVIVHEFEHNQCGSQTTMESPFDFWLNEAFTVDVERQFMSDHFDPTVVRLREVDAMRDPLIGPLAMEDGGSVGRIVRDGFNDPDELVDGVTYVKAAEVIRMLRLVVGQDAFKRGKNLYFQRYLNGNANSDQFFACFEETAGRSLEQFKQTWLYTIGYPRVTARSRYSAAEGELKIDLQQQTPAGLAPFHLPLEVALLDEEGREMPGTGGTVEINSQQTELRFAGLSKAPAVISLNRGCSFYGTFEDLGADHQDLALQARLDSDPFNRVEAWRRLCDRQRVALLQDPEAGIDPRWLDLFGELLDDGSLSPGLKAYFLRIDEQPLDRRYLAWYRELVAARDRMMTAINQAYRSRLLDSFAALHSKRPRRSPEDGIEERMLAAVLLEQIVWDDRPESHRLILEHYQGATTASERVMALLMLNRSSAAERREVLEEAWRRWHGHLKGYANYLRVIAGGTCPDVFAQIDHEKARPEFDITQPTWARALFLPMAANNRMLWSEHGIIWLRDQVVELAAVNVNTASRMLNAFQLVHSMRPPLDKLVRLALEEVASQVSAQASPTIHQQAASYLGG